jgi:hypothetical protein
MSTPTASAPSPPAPTPESRPRVRKVATAPPARDRLRREAAALRRGAHPNVVRLASFLDTTDRTELHLEHAGDHTLVTTAPPDGPAAVAFAASLAATVADLHGLGVVHGRLTPDHVVVAPGGRPVLCGLSEAQLGDTTSDIRALATLLEVLASEVPAPGNRRDRRALATLLHAADRARNGQPVPTATDLARLLGAHPVTSYVPAPASSAPPSSAPGSAIASRTPRAPRGRPSARVAVAGASAVVAFGTAAWLLHAVTTGGDDQGAPWRSTVPPSTVSTAPTDANDGTTPSPPAPPGASNVVPARFESDGATFEVGESGDIVVTGDWDCDGRRGAALLRERTGEVFVFDVLAPPGEPVPGRPLTPMPDAVALETIEQPGGCDSLVARRADGGADVIAVAPR